MKIRKLIASVLTGGIILTSGSAFSMPTDQFDAGVEKGISYFNQGLYYEARDEFQWFADYNWGALNEGQQQYLLDYLGAAKREIQKFESTTRINTDIFQYLGKSKYWLSQNFGGLYGVYEVGAGGYGYVYNNSPYCFVMPWNDDHCNGFIVPLNQFILNPSWSYSQSELERVLGCRVERFDDYYDDGTSGYSFTYNNCYIMISSGDTVYGWDGRVYSDYDVRIFGN